MAKISRIEPKIPALKKRQKVAAYARVSMETDRLAHSLSAQVSYYNDLIQANPEWEFAGVYADFGISGTGTAKRDEFNRLIADCEAGKVDIVLTKSISRFATVTDCFQGKIRCAICGNTYHRVNSGGRWVYWYCIGKKRNNVECRNVNYADFKLRRISASILGLEEFDEAEFERQIEEIVVLEDGSLEYHFREGRTQTWQRM